MKSSPSLLAQDTELSLLDALLPFVQPNFVDVGAEQGAFSNYLLSRGFEGLALEPLPKHSGALEALCRTGRLKYIPVAADEEDRRAMFHIACSESGEPLDYYHSLQKLDCDTRVKHGKSIEVTCRSLSSLHDEGLCKEALGVLKIDTEGNDLRVLNGLGGVRADVLMCEFFTEGIYNGWSDANPSRIITKARELKYNHWVAVRRRGPLEFVSLNTLFFTPQEWGNLIFINSKVYESAEENIARKISEIEALMFEGIEKYRSKQKGKWKFWARNK